MTSDPEKQINNNWTVGELTEKFEGDDFLPSDPEKDHFLCDFCSKGVAYESNPRVGHYIADDVLNSEHPVWQKHGGSSTLVPLASYCEKCSTRMLLFPCEGFAEVRMFFDLDGEKVMKDVEVTDLSPRDDGIPWEPKELSERITQIQWEQQSFVAMLSGQDDLWGPENMVTFFLSSVDGVDIRQLVKWDGSFDPKLLGQARRKYKEFSKKMRKEGHSRKKFRDHVRGDEES
jgi:hypothetical protein